MNDFAKLINNAEGLLAIGRPDRAEAVILSGLAAEPDNVDLLFLLTRVQMITGRGAAAVATAEHLRTSDPVRTRSHWIYALAVCQAWQFNPKRIRELAVPAAEEAVRLGPRLAETHYYLAHCLIQSTRFLWANRGAIDQARAAALEATRLAPEWVPPLLELAAIEKAASNRARARNYAEAALHRDPTDSEVLLSAIDHARFSHRRSLIRRLATTHPSHSATDLVLKTHRPIPAVVRLFGYGVIGITIGIGDSVNLGELRRGQEYMWIVGPIAGFLLAALGLGWRQRSLAKFDQEVRVVVFGAERRLRWLRRGVFWWLLVMPVLWIPSSLIGDVPAAWAVAWVFAGVVTVLMTRPRFGFR